MESVSQAAIIAAQQKAYARCVQQLDNLVILLTAPDNADGSQLSKPEYTVRRATLLKEKLTLEELLRDTGKRVEQQLKLSEQTFEFACSAQERFANGDAMVKKEMIATFASNLTLTDKMLSVQAKKPYFILEQSLAATNFQTTPIEPGFVGPVQGSNGRVTSDRPYVLGGLDEDRTKRDRMLRISALVYAHFEAEFPRVCGKRDYGEAPGKL
jgi:hypothetical protein